MNKSLRDKLIFKISKINNKMLIIIILNWKIMLPNFAIRVVDCLYRLHLLLWKVRYLENSNSSMRGKIIKQRLENKLRL